MMVRKGVPRSLTVPGWLLLLAVAAVLMSCSLVVRPPAEEKLAQLSARTAALSDWLDDLGMEGMEAALQQSIGYYRGLPPDREFTYAGYAYSPEEMAASLELFITVINAYHGEERIRELHDKFLFFESTNNNGNAFFTGYYEPLLSGSLDATEEFPEPVYKTPDDLIAVDLGQFFAKWDGEKIVGRLDGNRLIPYDDRDSIVYEKSLHARAVPLAYTGEVDLFFLQIQGSGLIQLSDGTVKRVNYAEKNGHPYTSIGQVLRDRIPPEEMSLQSIKRYLLDHPGETRDILSHNKSYVFFREVDEGPLGNINVPLTPGRSIAMDSRLIPRGSLAYIETSIPVFRCESLVGRKTIRRFAVVQDTGGAIRGHGRVDIFFGHGSEAELTAGHLQEQGRVFVIAARKEYLPPPGHAK